MYKIAIFSNTDVDYWQNVFHLYTFTYSFMIIYTQYEIELKT